MTVRCPCRKVYDPTTFYHRLVLSSKLWPREANRAPSTRLGVLDAAVKNNLLRVVHNKLAPADKHKGKNKIRGRVYCILGSLIVYIQGNRLLVLLCVYTKSNCHKLGEQTIGAYINRSFASKVE